jgi:hypothetical protein
MIEIEIRNFQSIDHVALKVEGFAAVTGRSNLGKSAVVRAMEAALTGAPVEGFVRHGQYCLRLVKGSKTCKCVCSVHMRTEGFDLFWEKGDAINRYVFNGQEYTVAGRGTPDFLQEGFALVKVGEERTLLQVAEQWNSIFLLNQTGLTVADVLSDVARLDRINVAMRLAEKDRKEAASLRKVREKDAQELRVRVAAYDGLDAAVVRVGEIEVEERKVLAAREKVGQLDRYITEVHGLARQVKGLQTVTALAVPDDAPVVALGDTVAALGRFAVILVDRQATVASLQGVEDVVAPDVEPVEKGGVAFTKLDAWLTKFRTYKDLFARWKPVEAAVPPDVDQVTKAGARFAQLSAFAARVEALGRVITVLETQEATAAVEEAAVKAESDALGLCPTCARPAVESHAHGVAAE